MTARTPQQTLEELWSKIAKQKIVDKQLFHVRIDLRDEEMFLAVKEFFKQFPLYVLSSIETKSSGTLHVHGIAEFHDKSEKLRLKIKETLLVSTTQYSVSYVRNVEQATKYCIKEGYTSYKGIPQDLMTKLKKLSYLKADKQNIKSKLNDLREKYLLDPKIEIHHVYCDFIDWSCTHNKTWSETHLKSTFRLWFFQKNELERNNYARLQTEFLFRVWEE